LTITSPTLRAPVLQRSTPTRWSMLAEASFGAKRSNTAGHVRRKSERRPRRTEVRGWCIYGFSLHADVGVQQLIDARFHLPSH